MDMGPSSWLPTLCCHPHAGAGGSTTSAQHRRRAIHGPLLRWISCVICRLGSTPAARTASSDLPRAGGDQAGAERGRFWFGISKQGTLSSSNYSGFAWTGDSSMRNWRECPFSALSALRLHMRGTPTSQTYRALWMGSFPPAGSFLPVSVSVHMPTSLS